jgi:hypothetical protein
MGMVALNNKVVLVSEKIKNMPIIKNIYPQLDKSVTLIGSWPTSMPANLNERVRSMPWARQRQF